MDFINALFLQKEIEIQHNELGRGEFGIVYAVAALHVVEECPCPNCRQERDTRQESESRRPLHPQHNAQQHAQIIEGVIPEETRKINNPQEGGNNGNTTSSTSMHLPKSLPSSVLRRSNNNLHAIISPSTTGETRVSFAEDLQLLHRLDADEIATTSPLLQQQQHLDDAAEDSTLSTTDGNDGDSMGFPDIGGADIMDGEVELRRGYMAKHVTRGGLPRYAVKRLRSDMTVKERMVASIDLACEAKIMASISHPNIVRVRGTVSTPGATDFMIVMDCLKITLTDKIQQWRQEEKQHSKQHGGGLQRIKTLGGLLKSSKKNGGMDDLFADKMLAMYDIARAMRYLHNNRYVRSMLFLSCSLFYYFSSILQYPISRSQTRKRGL
jgi:serine/threonine protein kinase